MIFKARIKFEAEDQIDSGEIYKLMVDLAAQVPTLIYIEIEDEEGEIVGHGKAGEDAG